jgi:hypothetical protein
LFEAVIAGCGLIVIVNVIGVPVQVPIDGVTVIVPVIGEEVLFVPVKAGNAPVPLAASPMAGLELVQS